MLISCLLSSIFVFAYMIANICQTLFIIYAYSQGRALNVMYLYQTVYQFNFPNLGQPQETFHMLFLAKYMIFNFIYVIYCPSKCFMLSVNDHSKTNIKDFGIKIQRARQLHKYNLLVNTINLSMGIIILLSMNHIVDGLFGRLQWTSQYLSEVPHNNYFAKAMLRDYGGHATNLDLLRRFTVSGYFYGIIAYYLMELTINYRTISYKMFERNYPMFFVIIFTYISAFSWVAYLLEYQCDSFFYGMSGFLVAYGTFGFLCFPIIYIMNGYKLGKKYVQYYPELVKHSSKHALVWKQIRINSQIIKLTNEATNHVSK